MSPRLGWLVPVTITLAACSHPERGGSVWMPTGGWDGGAADDGNAGDGSSGDGNATGGNATGGDGVDDGAGDAADGGHTTAHGDGAGGSDGGGDGGNAAVPELGSTFTVIGTSADGLDIPRDLEFDPADSTVLWTSNRGIDGNVIFFDPGEPSQSSEVRVDLYAQHFAAEISSMAMGDNERWACCNESRDDWNGGPQPEDDFMGPTLWTTDLSIHGLPTSGEGSHYDMLHQSPLCMGIAHESANRYWVFDGLNGHIVYYDFNHDHGPGGTDHSDGTTRRFTEATVTRVPDVPGHMEIDHTTNLLYVADTGAGRIMILDITSGAYAGSLPGNWDGLDEYSQWTGASWTEFVGGLGKPSGLAIDGGRLFVSDYATQEIIAYDLSTKAELGRTQTDAVGIMGIIVGPNDHLWYVDGLANELVRIDA